jgi:germination protein M
LLTAIKKISAKKFFMVTALILLLAGLGAGAWFYTRSGGGYLPVEVYFFNPRTHQLEAERRTVPESSPEAMTGYIIQMLQEHPRNGNLRRAIPDELYWERWSLEGTTLEISFPPQYREIPPVEEVLFRASLVWTATELPFVDSVRVLVEGEPLLNAQGEPLGLENRHNVLVGPTLNPRLIVPRNVVLYFMNEELNGLVSERRVIDVNPNLPLERFIIENLIEGPRRAGSHSAIPAGTRIRDVETVEGICTINLSGDFVNRFTGLQTMAELTLYSIVHSIKANVNHVRSVQFLIDSERRDMFHGVPDFNIFFEWDERWDAQE